MDKWADYLISEASYDASHLITAATRHRDTDSGVTKGATVDRLTISSDIRNGITYITIYSGENSWKRGRQIRTFSIGGEPFLRIDKNKVGMDSLGDLPGVTGLEEIPEEATAEQMAMAEQLERQIREMESRPSRGALPKETADELPQELDMAPEEVEEASNPKGALPKETADELPQELDMAPEPVGEEEAATPEQVARPEELEKKIQEIESRESTPDSVTEPEEATPEQLARLEELERQIQRMEAKPKESFESIPDPALRGALPKESTEELPQELDMAPEPEAEEPSTEPEESTPEQMARLEQLEKQIRETEAGSEPRIPSEAIPEAPPRGALPKETADELPQELDMSPEPVAEEEEATPEQIARLEELERQIREMESGSAPEPATESEEATSEQFAILEQMEEQIRELAARLDPPEPKGALPKETTEELPQELDPTPEPIAEEQKETAAGQLDEMHRQLDELESRLAASPVQEVQTEPAEEYTEVDDLKEQIDELEDELISRLHPSDEPTEEQIARVQSLEREVERLMAADIEGEIIESLQKQDKKLDSIQKKMEQSDPSLVTAYCVRCKTKRTVRDPQQTTMKNGRPAIRGKCSTCGCKVFRIGKLDHI